MFPANSTFSGLFFAFSITSKILPLKFATSEERNSDNTVNDGSENSGTYIIWLFPNFISLIVYSISPHPYFVRRKTFDFENIPSKESASAPNPGISIVVSHINISDRRFNQAFRMIFGYPCISM
ncbi:hypothetical protein bpr_II357 (plasmid) [Butyrivibrio proteoclasticus B316]|uniref:Uncharacterized protein n=1 Tax=Butyrivibrio proteoclasticus (strain ATCC 51982 / DSM 14932 / B316) TaxID=515622 RepID=E0S4G2_BUTPB|nr:hypothetical protein bpr_II357 [Butyrivibrio proteoclasticus B316]